LHPELQRTFAAGKMKLSMATGLGRTDYLELQVHRCAAEAGGGQGALSIWAKETKELYRQAASADLAPVTA